MPTPRKTTGSGTKAFFSTDGSKYDLFASITKVSPPSMSRGTVKVSDMNSYEDNDQFNEYLVDFIEGDNIDIEGYFIKDDAGRNALEAAFYEGTECYIKIQLPPVIGQDMVVKGVLVTYRPLGEISTDAGIAFSASIKPNGKPTMSATVASDGG